MRWNLPYRINAYGNIIVTTQLECSLYSIYCLFTLRFCCKKMLTNKCFIRQWSNTSLAAYNTIHILCGTLSLLLKAHWVDFNSLNEILLRFVFAVLVKGKMKNDVSAIILVTMGIDKSKFNDQAWFLWTLYNLCAPQKTVSRKGIAWKWKNWDGLFWGKTQK